MELDFENIFQELKQKTAYAIATRFSVDPIMIGVLTGGVWVAERLHKELNISTPLCELNINFYRDDFEQGGGIRTKANPSDIQLPIEGRDIILVDDVLQTGRTIRAALNEIFDYGRPQSVSLAVLVSRKQRQLPICADVAGIEVDLNPKQTIKLKGPQPLHFEVIENDSLSP